MLYSHITPFTMACHNANIATLQFHSHQQKKHNLAKSVSGKNHFTDTEQNPEAHKMSAHSLMDLPYTPPCSNCIEEIVHRGIACLRTMCNLPSPPKTPCTPECRDASLGTPMTSEKTHIERNADDLQCNPIFAAWNKHVICFLPEDNFSINQTIIDCCRTSTRNKEK